jgi:hypothetical protein
VKGKEEKYNQMSKEIEIKKYIPYDSKPKRVGFFLLGRGEVGFELRALHLQSRHSVA